MKKDLGTIVGIVEAIELAVLMVVGIVDSFNADNAIIMQVVATTANAIILGVGFVYFTLKEKKNIKK